MQDLRIYLFVYGLPAVVAAVLFALLGVVLPTSSYLHSFFFLSWPIQWLSTYLCLTGVFAWLARLRFFRSERYVADEARLPDFTIGAEQASELLRGMPDQHRRTFTMRRYREILQGFVNGEDLIRLNEELSTRDHGDVERGYWLLDSLRNIIPIIGFLGTVLGLSMGMVSFPEISNPATLRTALRSFALSLSVAFDTTLLALAYTIVIIMLITYLRQREYALLGIVDDQARRLIAQIRFRPGGQQTGPVTSASQLLEHLNEWSKQLAALLDGGVKGLAVQNAELADKVTAAVDVASRQLCEAAEKLAKEVKAPPRYEVIVRPAEPTEHGNEAS